MKNEIVELNAKLAAMETELSSLPAKWSEDSSLKTWFPITSNELESLREEVAELRSYKEAAESQKPDCWRITHPSFCGIVTDKKEIAEDPFYSGCVFPLYANPVPADHAEKNLEIVSQRITEQDAMSILLEWDAYRAERSASGVTPAHFKKWLNLVGRTLLNKLNADREQVPAVAVPEEMTKMKAIDLIPEVDDDYGSNLFVKGWNICRAAMLAAAPSDSQQSADTVTEGFKVIPELPHGFNHSAYNRHTGEWVYLNHANTWQLFQGPIAATPSHSQQSADVTIAGCDKKSITAEQYRTLVILARRAMHIAYVWNDHNFPPAHMAARETAKSLNIYDLDGANDFIANLPIQHLQDGPRQAHARDSEQGGDQ